MTPEERDRLARLESEYANMKEWVKDIHTDVKTLVAQANQAKGGGRVFAVLMGLGGGALGAKLLALLGMLGK